MLKYGFGKQQKLIVSMDIEESKGSGRESNCVMDNFI